MKEVADILFSLIRYELTGKEPPVSSPDMLGAIYTLSNKHDIAHIVGSALKKSSVGMTEELSKKFDQKQFTAFFRYEQSKYELERIKDVFEAQKIPFVPLKGSVLRELYPEPWMRTSCDIDILVKEDDLDAATDALRSRLDYAVKGRGSHDVQLKSSGNVNIELHYTLIEENFVSKPVENVLNDAWNYASPENGGYLYAFTDEFFLFYHVAHMAKHFTVGGGCGIRPFLDLYILERTKRTETDLILKNGLMPFYDAAKKLSGVWFSEGSHDKLTEAMEKYVLEGGVYGNMQNRVTTGKSKSGSGFSYVFVRLFPSYKIMKNKHPSLRKCPLLLPFFYVKRWITPLFDGRFKKTAKELNLSARQETNTEYSEMIKKLGI